MKLRCAFNELYFYSHPLSTLITSGAFIYECLPSFACSIKDFVQSTWIYPNLFTIFLWKEVLNLVVTSFVLRGNIPAAIKWIMNKAPPFKYVPWMDFPTVQFLFGSLPPQTVDLSNTSIMTKKHINQCFVIGFQYINFNKYIGINFAI